MKSVPRLSFYLLETSTKTRVVFPGTIYADRIDLINLGWLNELGRWMQQLIQAYHQYGIGSRLAL